jgi:hypothetical protein
MSFLLSCAKPPLLPALLRVAKAVGCAVFLGGMAGVFGETAVHLAAPAFFNRGARGASRELTISVGDRCRHTRRRQAKFGRLHTADFVP